MTGIIFYSHLLWCLFLVVGQNHQHRGSRSRLTSLGAPGHSVDKLVHLFSERGDLGRVHPVWCKQRLVLGVDLDGLEAVHQRDLVSLPVSTPDGLEVSGTATSAAVLFTTSMLNYESITVQVMSAGTGCTISYETSCDSVVWLACGGVPSINLGASGSASTSTTGGQTQFPRRGLYFRVRVSTYGSGTVSIIAVLSKTPFVQLGALFIAGGAGSEGGATGTNPLSIGLEARTSSKTSVANSTLVRPIAKIGRAHV